MITTTATVSFASSRFLSLSLPLPRSGMSTKNQPCSTSIISGLPPSDEITFTLNVISCRPIYTPCVRQPVHRSRFYFICFLLAECLNIKLHSLCVCGKLTTRNSFCCVCLYCKNANEWMQAPSLAALIIMIMTRDRHVGFCSYVRVCKSR